MTVANILLILGQFILSMVIEIYMYPDAEADRLKGLFDDSLDTQMLEKPCRAITQTEYCPAGFGNCWLILLRIASLPTMLLEK